MLGKHQLTLATLALLRIVAPQRATDFPYASIRREFGFASNWKSRCARSRSAACSCCIFSPRPLATPGSCCCIRASGLRVGLLPCCHIGIRHLGATYKIANDGSPLSTLLIRVKCDRNHPVPVWAQVPAVGTIFACNTAGLHKAKVAVVADVEIALLICRLWRRGWVAWTVMPHLLWCNWSGAYITVGGNDERHEVDPQA